MRWICNWHTAIEYRMNYWPFGSGIPKRNSLPALCAHFHLQKRTAVCRPKDKPCVCLSLFTFLCLFFLSFLSSLSLLPCILMFLFSTSSLDSLFLNSFQTQTQTGTWDRYWMSCCSVPLSYLLCADSSLPTQNHNERLHPHRTVGKTLHQAALFANMNSWIWELYFQLQPW